MRIITILIFIIISLSGWAAEIIDLPDEMAESYDISCRMNVSAQSDAPVCMSIESGYNLRISTNTAELLCVGKTIGKSVLSMKSGDNSFSIKRRPGTIALLVNHRLVFYAPMPQKPSGMASVGTIPANITINSIRYYDIAAPVFGDDFMRPDALNKTTTSGVWIEDDLWKVGYYKKENPGAAATDPATEKPMANPWLLSLYPVVDTTTNAFWFVFRGVGPSWAAVRDNLAYPTWDSYYVETSVRPEFDSMVGVIAGYQDNQNYLLFRVKQRNYVNPNAAGLCELIAVNNGFEKVIASGNIGFNPNQWYKLRINFGLKRVQALIDDQVVLESFNTAPAEGGIGLYGYGAENPRKIQVDDVTADMYKIKDDTTGKIINDAAEVMRKNSVIYYDDVKVGEWLDIPDVLNDSPYKVDGAGSRNVKTGIVKLPKSARILTGIDKLSNYEENIVAKTSTGRNASMTVLFNLENADTITGYAWTLTAKGQKLTIVENGKDISDAAESAIGIVPGVWQSLKVNVNGAYIRLYVNDALTLEYYGKELTSGRFGITSAASAIEIKSMSIKKMPPPQFNTVDIHPGFETDKWMSTWSSPEADWYPAEIPTGVVPYWAAPMPTNLPGLYWYKGSIYNDFKIKVPISAATTDGQKIYLSPGPNAKDGYMIELSKSDEGGIAVFSKKGEKICTGKFTYGELSQLVLYRQGGYYILVAQKLDKEDTSKEQDVKEEEVVFKWKDANPIKTDKFGFNVTVKELPAALISVQSNRVMDAFESAPSGWVSASGIWLVMARFSCQPKWNWFGGFGKDTPTIWTKNRLNGDQNFEAYMGVKMQYENAPAEERMRFRDLNVAICTDGSHLNTGYSVIRGGKPLGTPVTMLVRNGVIVKSSAELQHQLPLNNIGHRQWFATRIEKRTIETTDNGKKSVKAEISVYLDNRLALTYIDDNPIMGGYAAIWTLDNGVMLGRANYSAESILPGSPRAAAPLAIMEEIKPNPVPAITVNAVPVQISTFEKDNDGWKDRKGITARILREESRGIKNSYLKVVNSYPAGDFSVDAPIAGIDFNNTPTLSFDYCFDAGTSINLYARCDAIWYEIILTGKPGQDKSIVPAGTAKLSADGEWHHAVIDIKTILTDAITKQTGVKPATGVIDQLTFADWATAPEIKQYGFANNPGGTAIRFDNFCFLPDMGKSAFITWTLPTEITNIMTSINNNIFAKGNIISAGTLTVPAGKTPSLIHIMGINDKDEPLGIINLPAPVMP